MDRIPARAIGAVDSPVLPNAFPLFNHTPVPPDSSLFSSSAGEFSQSQQDQDLLLSFSSARLSSSSSFQGNGFPFLSSSNTTAALSNFQRHTLFQQYVLNTTCVTSRPTTSADAAASRPQPMLVLRSAPSPRRMVECVPIFSAVPSQRSRPPSDTALCASSASRESLARSRKRAAGSRSKVSHASVKLC